MPYSGPPTPLFGLQDVEADHVDTLCSGFVLRRPPNRGIQMPGGFPQDVPCGVAVLALFGQEPHGEP
eukprot:11446947-Heterocapsa_arctica.AAC.1